MRASAWSAAIVAVGMLGCGGDDGSASVDSGPGPGDDGGEASSYLLSVRVVDPDGTPLEGVLAAVDSSADRFEGESDADGQLDIAFDAEAGEMITVIYATHRFAIRADELAVDDVSDERTDAVLRPVGGDTGRVNVAVSTTGVPSGGRICTSFMNFSLCSDPGETSLTVPVFASGLGERVHVFAIDDTETVVDFADAAIPEGDSTRSVAVDFDGSLEATPTVRNVTLRFPPSDDSLFSSFEPTPLFPAYFNGRDAESGLMYGIATNVVRDESTLTLTYTEIPSDGPLLYAAFIYPDLMSRGSTSFNFYPEDPGDTADVQGVPILMTGDRFTSSFEWSPPDGDFVYLLGLGNAAGVLHVEMWTRDTNATLPDLPTGFDRDADESVFPYADAPGVAWVVAIDREAFEADEGSITNSSSARRSISF